MAKTPQKGAVGTTTQQRPTSSRAHLARQASAASYIGRQAEQGSLEKAETGKTKEKASSSNDVANTTTEDTEGMETKHMDPLLINIMDSLERIQNDYKMEEAAKKELKKLAKYVKEEAEARSIWLAEPKEQAKVSAIHLAVRRDLQAMCEHLNGQFNQLGKANKEVLDIANKTLKEAEETKGAVKDTATEVSKVTKSTDKLASETVTYRDALLATPKQANKVSTDPRILSDMDRKARQILVEIFDTEGNNTLEKSVTELVKKANEVLASLQGADKPKDIKVLTALKMRNETLLLTLNSKESAEWVSETKNEIAFTDAFSEGSHIRGRVYNLIVPRVPITFEPSNLKHLREAEEVNSLEKYAIKSVRWIKPIERRCLDQTHAFAVFSIATAGHANLLIKDGLNICGTKVRPKRQKTEPMQCMKCQRWGHFANNCQAEKESCGTCGAAHCTNTCNNKSKVYCVSCDDNSHASWDRNCPEFIRRCAIFDEHNPKNRMPYYPMEQDWTLVTRLGRLPMEERYLKKFTVNSLPTQTGKKKEPIPLGTLGQTEQTNKTKCHRAR